VHALKFGRGTEFHIEQCTYRVCPNISSILHLRRSGTNNACLRGNAFALFLKSQRKWDNPPLQNEHKEQFLKFCLDHDYDAAKLVFSILLGGT
jgi:endonuclease IV